MKKLAVILIMLSALISKADNWETMVPQGIPVNYIDVYNYHYISGNTLYTLSNENDTVIFDLPITDVEVIFYEMAYLITVGDGSYSDALYKFIPETDELIMIDYFIKPQFIDKFNDIYYLGCQGALYQSTDGISWNIHTQFENNELVLNYYEFNSNRLLLVRKEVSENEIQDYIVHSEDNGETWQTNTLTGEIVDNDFNIWTGKLALILVDDSDATAIYKSEDNGNTISFIKSFSNLNLIKIMGDGGYGLAQSRDTSQSMGVSLYGEGLDHLVYLNDNLPTRNILFLESFMMDCFNLTVGTDVGAFWICGMYTDIVKSPTKEKITIYPNPASNEIIIHPSMNISEPATIKITNMQGQKIYTKEENTHIEKIVIDISSFPRGCYFVSLFNSNKWIASKKFIKTL